MRLLFLNQYGPPDSPPTARLLGELAAFLRSRGHEVEILSPRDDYQGRPASGGGRMRRELAALVYILRTGWPRQNPRPDVILALSSPPGLLVVGAILAWRHRSRLAHWAMDLYPELALALGEVRPGILASAVGAAMRWAYRRCGLVVALDEDMCAHLQPFCRRPVRTLEPWPPAATAQRLDAGWLTGPGPSTAPAVPTWLYSGNLGRAHEWKTLLDAQRILETRGLPIRLVFQGDGAAWPAARAYAGDLRLTRCEWQGYVPENDLLPSLLDASALVVTQRPETRGLLWPSKLAVLERLPRPILFVGPVAGAIARRLRARGQTGVFAPGEAQAVAGWIEARLDEPVGQTPDGRPEPTVPPPWQTLEHWLAELV